jgi:hypothetical protein
MTLLDLLKNMLYADGFYYGTVLCQNETMRIYWSPLEWKSPNDGLFAQPNKWLCLGQDGWWSGDEIKKIFVDLQIFVKFPQWPGDWDYFDDRPL